MKPIPTIVLSMLVLSGWVSSVALAQTDAPNSCALRQPNAPRPRGLGTILGFEDQATARAEIPRREAHRGGAIDPHYLDDLRAVVKQDNGIIDTFDVPSGMTARTGDRVRLQGSSRSMAAACSYIPQMAIPMDAPAA